MPLKDLRTQLWHLRTGGVGQWRRHRARRAVPRMPATDATQPATALPAWQLPDRAPRRALRVGIVADEFTELCLRHAWHHVLLTPGGWQEALADGIDLLFVESAWNGNGGAWRYQLTGSKAPSQPLQDLVRHCRDQGVPTVFWNKEDPIHFEDFLDTAALFDHVLTTEEDRVADYVERLGHDRVAVLPFAAASWVHNPVRPTGGAARDVAFGGMYYRHRFPERRAQMDLLLGAAARVSPRMTTGLEIFSRFLGTDENYQFPDDLAAHVVGELTYPQMLTAYRGYKVFLNVSSVPESRSMCPRRLFEISACATPVVSTPTPAIERFFDADAMVTVTEPQEAEWVLRGLVRNDQWRERLGHRAARTVLARHTYRHRVDELLGLLGMEQHRVADPTVSVVASTHRPQQLDHLLAQVAAQEEVDPQLVLVTHGFAAPADLAARAGALGVRDLVLVEAGADLSLGECLNLGVARADGDVVAKMDDDDLYGPHYLADQLRALDYSGADVVGKQAHHMLLRGSGCLLVRFPEREHRFTDMVMGPTLMMRRELLAELPFATLTRGEDTDLLRRVLLRGGRIYSADRFGFVQVREASGHTWEATDAELLANGNVVAYGTDVRHAFV
ncbi:glycosyltransferase family protein [Actinosynnema sp.]|uniref:glycosyltransferase family protein n=1 Tax=Actinosynnema sp. TaxID=1872144 RepID=UPI003F83F39F